MKKIIWKIIKTIFFLAIAGVFVWTIYYLYQKDKEVPVVYETTQPFVTNIIKKTVATGAVNPRREIEIKPQVSGIIKKLYVEPGEMVKSGDIIAKVKIIPDMISLNNAKSRLNRAKINFEKIKITFERQKKLYEKSVIAEADFNQAETDYKNALEEIETSESNLQLIKEGATKKSGSTSNTLIRSTIDGMILDVPVKEGNSVIESNTFNEGTTIATIADMGEMIFKGNVDESEVGKIEEGMDLIIKIGAIEDTEFKAKLEYISPKGVSQNGTIQFEIRAAMELLDSVFVRAGYSANADIVLQRKDNVLALEESVVIFENDSTFVKIEKGEQVFEKIQVKLGLSDGINVEIIEGLNKESKIQKPISSF